MKTTKEFTQKDLVGREQAAKILGVTKTILDIYRGRGDLNPVPTIGFRTYFLRSEVLAFKRQRMIKLRKQAKKKAQAEKPSIQNQISHENNKS